METIAKKNIRTHKKQFQVNIVLKQTTENKVCQSDSQNCSIFTQQNIKLNF